MQKTPKRAIQDATGKVHRVWAANMRYRSGFSNRRPRSGLVALGGQRQVGSRRALLLLLQDGRGVLSQLRSSSAEFSHLNASPHYTRPLFCQCSICKADTINKRRLPLPIDTRPDNSESLAYLHDRSFSLTQAVETETALFCSEFQRDAVRCASLV